jgi:hypothetical protein
MLALGLIVDMVDDLIRGVTPPKGDSFYSNGTTQFSSPQLQQNCDELAATIVVDTSLGLG